MKTIQYGDYKLKTALPVDQGKSFAEDILNQTYRVEQVFKQDKNGSYVAKINHSKFGELIYKEPLFRNHSFWERLRSLILFRDSYAFRSFDSHIKALELGFKTAKPILAIEKRKFGVVVDSIFLYEYIAGRAGNNQDFEILAPIMIELYNQRYIRGDAKADNFLIKDNEAYLIDFILEKPILFQKLRVQMEFWKFCGYFPETLNRLPAEEANSFGLKLAKFIRKTLHKFRDFKNLLKRKLIAK